MANGNFIGGGCKGTSVYTDQGKTLIGRNVDVTLPNPDFGSVEPRTAGGVATFAITSFLNSMEMTITKQGIDDAWISLCDMDSKEITINISQQSVDNNAGGINGSEHIQAIVTAASKNIPSVTATPGEIMESEISFNVYSYKLFRDGQLYLHLDPLKGKCIINGKDYMEAVNSHLG